MSQLTPVPASARIELLDVLRGFALPGILAMNIRATAGPFGSYMYPSAMLEFEDANRLAEDVVEATADTRSVHEIVAEGVHGLDEEEWQLALRVDQIIDRLGLDAGAYMHRLSDGWRPLSFSTAA